MAAAPEAGGEDGGRVARGAQKLLDAHHTDGGLRRMGEGIAGRLDAAALRGIVSELDRDMIDRSFPDAFEDIAFNAAMINEGSKDKSELMRISEVLTRAMDAGAGPAPAAAPAPAPAAPPPAGNRGAHDGAAAGGARAGAAPPAGRDDPLDIPLQAPDTLMPANRTPPRRLPAALPPRPPRAEDLSTWLYGAPGSAHGLGLKVDITPEEVGDIEEIEMAFLENHLKAASRMELRDPLPDTAGRDILEGLREGLEIDRDGARRALAAAATAYLSERGPDHAGLLTRGVHLTLLPEAMEAVETALALEARFLRDTPGPSHLPPQVTKACVYPKGALDRPVVVQRMMWLHMDGGVGVRDALIQGLAELRDAQFQQTRGVIVTPEEFDDLFFENCLAELSEYAESLSAEMDDIPSP